MLCKAAATVSRNLWTGQKSLTNTRSEFSAKSATRWSLKIGCGRSQAKRRFFAINLAKKGRLT
jgi:hypothetical protein